MKNKTPKKDKVDIAVILINKGYNTVQKAIEKTIKEIKNEN